MEVDALVVLKPCWLEFPTEPRKAPQWEANDDTEDDTSSAEWRSHRRIIGRITEYQGRDAEENIDYQRRKKGVTSDGAEVVMDGVEEIADGPEKKEDGDVQEHVCAVHEPPHLELVKALE